MALFHDVRLPVHIERGAEGGPRFKTSVIILSSGIEQRNIEWSRARGEWDIGYSIQQKADYSEILQFFYARRGMAYGFRFKDWSDYQCFGQFLGKGTEASKVFYLTKDYTDLGGTYSRIITRPVVGTIAVYSDGVPVSFTLGAAGKITITSLLPKIFDPAFPDIPAETPSDITATFEFDCPVRFDVDNLQVNMEWEDAADIGGITIVELKEQR